MAVLTLPVVLLVSANAPIALFPAPVVFADRAKYPNPEL
jgi:hypothetical protein